MCSPFASARKTPEAPKAPAVNRQFVQAGNATFTVAMPAEYAAKHGTPGHYTFKVVRKEATKGFPEAYFVSLLAGPDNESDYSYVGMLQTASGGVRLTRASKYADDSQPVVIVRRVLAALWQDRGAAITAGGWNLHHEGRCCRCGRKLTVPSSIAIGIGPECEKLMAV